MSHPVAFFPNEKNCYLQRGIEFNNNVVSLDVTCSSISKRITCCNVALLCMVQVLFIAPVYGKNRPQLAYQNLFAKEVDSLHNIKTLKQKGASPKDAQIEKVRKANTMQRPKRSGSKVLHS